MDKDLRKTLRNVVTKCRKLLEDAIGELLQGHFGIHADGNVEDASRLTHLFGDDLRYRDEVLAHLDHIKASGLKAKDATQHLIREAAFTHLNRLCAYKMMAERGLLRDPVGKGLKSSGFLFYLADHPDDEALYNSAHQDIAYRHYFQSINEGLSSEIGVLFAHEDLATRLFPPYRVLNKVLDLINSHELANIWTENETIGWVYQYFTPREQIDRARKESRAPRNSYELAFRNQFYTPRYVVEFLVDNTLGRIWYEMLKGDTGLLNKCQFLIRRPNEKFLAPGEPPSGQENPSSELSQEQVLNQPSYIEHRAKKDPRELKVLDPACGSGHFLLYCFDVMELIYAEAYEDVELGPVLQQEYSTIQDLKRDVPRLVLEHNIHGIDIDLRSTQISALALWLRCQRTYKELGIESNSRPKIKKANIVCAEAMPGEHELLDEFLKDVYPPFLGEVVRVAFEKMKLAGEAGSLLQIEKEISGAIVEAKKHWRAIPQEQQLALFRKEKLPDGKQGALFDLSGITDEQFWSEADSRVVEALRDYAGAASNGKSYLRKLFAEDAAQGFAFIDVCRKRFDAILMNPPFGASTKLAKSYIDQTYPTTKGDLLANFIERTLDLCLPEGRVGAISSRTCFFLGSFASLREQVLKRDCRIASMVDLGDGVLEAMVETAMYVIKRHRQVDETTIFIRALLEDNKEKFAETSVRELANGRIENKTFLINTDEFSRLKGSPYCYWVRGDTIELLSQYPPLEDNAGSVRVGMQTGEDSRFLRLVWEVPVSGIGALWVRPERTDEFVKSIRSTFRQGRRWAYYSKTDVASPWISPLTLVVDWEHDGDVLKRHIRARGYSPSKWIQSEALYFRPGFSYMLRSTRLVPYIVPAGVIPTAGRSQVYPRNGKENALLGLCASNIASSVLRFSGGMFARPVFQAGMIQNIPVVEFPIDLVNKLRKKVATEFDHGRHVLEGHEPYIQFVRPRLLENWDTPTGWNVLSLLGSELEEEVADAFNLSRTEASELERDIREAVAIRELTECQNEEESQDEEIDAAVVDSIDQSPRSNAEGLLSYAVGVLFGRWDARIAKDRSLAPRPQMPFEPLPVCPPGTLLGTDGLPAKSGGIVSEEWLRMRKDAISLPTQNTAITNPVIADTDYPFNVYWDGIAIDDPDNLEDFVLRVRNTLEIILEDQFGAIEKDLHLTLNVNGLREYFRKTSGGGFWMDHVKRYSKSKRKAPIYWLLQSSRKRYFVWLYYHRLDQDILFKTLQRVTQKINQEGGVLKDLVRDRNALITSGGSVKQIDKKIESQEALLSEIEDFRDKLKRAADLNLDPDLNDGVVLNIAPLWELVPWAEAKKYWKELLEGKYEWSSIGKQLRERGLVAP